MKNCRHVIFGSLLCAPCNDVDVYTNGCARTGRLQYLTCSVIACKFNAMHDAELWHLGIALIRSPARQPCRDSLPVVVGPGVLSLADLSEHSLLHAENAKYIKKSSGKCQRRWLQKCQLPTEAADSRTFWSRHVLRRHLHADLGKESGVGSPPRRSRGYCLQRLHPPAAGLQCPRRLPLSRPPACRLPRPCWRVRLCCSSWPGRQRWQHYPLLLPPFRREPQLAEHWKVQRPPPPPLPHSGGSWMRCKPCVGGRAAAQRICHSGVAAMAECRRLPSASLAGRHPQQAPWLDLRTRRPPCCHLGRRGAAVAGRGCSATPATPSLPATGSPACAATQLRQPSPLPQLQPLHGHLSALLPLLPPMALQLPVLLLLPPLQAPPPQVLLCALLEHCHGAALPACRRQFL